MLRVLSAAGDLLPILFTVRVSAPAFNHTVWEHPLLWERRGEIRVSVTSPLMVRLSGLVLSAASFRLGQH